jgi:hypothetical protein
VDAEPGRFFDGESLDPSTPMRVVLERVVVDGRELFTMRHRIAYRDRHHAEPHVVPGDRDRFRSDLTSVPHLFTWLVPRTGLHLPAALLHDGLVRSEDEPISYLGPPVDREEADRIFRDAMGDLGTSVLRRWLMWTAVTLATVREGVIRPAAYYRTVVFGSIALIAVLGVLATLDLFDATVFGVAVELPWMGDRPLGQELVGGAVAAIVVPLVLAVLWGRLWRAGAIAGLALAFLLHVTIALVVLTGLYLAIEWAMEWMVERFSSR